MKEYDIKVNFIGRHIYPSELKLVQNDYLSTKMNFTYDTEASLYRFDCLFPNGEKYVDEIENGSLTLPVGFLSQKGIYKYEISAFDENRKLTALALGSLNVREDLFNCDEEVKLDDRTPILDKLISDVNIALKETDNLDIDAEKEGDTATITITKKDGTKKQVEIYDGTGGGEGGTSNYNLLSNKPKINNVELTGNKSLKDLGITPYDDTSIRNQINTINQDLGGIQDEIQSINNNIDGLEDNKADKTSIPTKTSQLNNDSNFLTQIPIASSSRLGGIKVGANLTMDSDGTLNATGGGGEGGTKDFNDLINKPQINGTTLSGNKTSADFGLASKSTTLSGYGITDAYTKNEVNNLISDITAEGGGIAKGTIGNNYLTDEVNNEISSVYLKNKLIEKYPTGAKGDLFNYGYVSSDLFDYKVENNMFLQKIEIKFGEGKYNDGDEVQCYLCTYNSETGKYKPEKKFNTTVNSNTAIFKIDMFLNEYSNVYFFFSGYATFLFNNSLYSSDTKKYWVNKSKLNIGEEFSGSVYGNSTYVSQDVKIYYSVPLDENEINSLFSEDNYKLSSGIISTNLVSKTNFEYGGKGNVAGYYMNILDVKPFKNCILKKIDIYTSVSSSTAYLCYKDKNDKYIIIDKFIGYSDNKLVSIYCNIDVSDYDNLYVACNSADYPRGEYKEGERLAAVSIDENAGEINVSATSGVNAYQNVNVYFQQIINTKDFSNLLSDKQYEETKQLIIQKNRTVYQDNLANLKVVFDEKFDSKNPMLTYTNSTISDEGLICSGYTRTYLTNGTAIDLVRNIVNFKYQSDVKFGTNIGGILALVDTSNKKFILYSNYNGGNTIPSSVVMEENISFDFENNNSYSIILEKNAMTFNAKLTNMSTMETITITYHEKNLGLGSPGIVSFSGNVLVNKFKYYAPLYKYAKVLFLGDSVTEGVGVESALDSRWCAQLRDKYFNYDALIAGVGGNNIPAGVSRYKQFVKLDYNFDYVIVFLGLNDMRNDGSIDGWKTNITNLRELIISNGSKPIICTPQLLSGNYTYAFEEARDFVLEKGWDCIRFDLISDTGLHPGVNGHNEMFEIAVKCLDNIGIN